MDKALEEPKYSSLYAQLCLRLAEDAPNFDSSSSEIQTSQKQSTVSQPVQEELLSGVNAVVKPLVSVCFLDLQKTADFQTSG